MTKAVTRAHAQLARLLITTNTPAQVIIPLQVTYTNESWA